MAFPLVAALMKGFKLGATGLGLMGGAPVGAARAGAGALNLLKQAYTPNAMGLMNLGMDAIPLVTDIANNDVGLKSFSGFGGTLAGTKFGGRELNKLGEQSLKKTERDLLDGYSYFANKRSPQQDFSLPQLPQQKPMGWTSPTLGVKPQQDYVQQPSFRQANPDRDTWVDIQLDKARQEALNNPKYSKQGYNMPIGMGADIGLYSLTSGMGKPKESPEVEALMKQQEMSNSPVSRYMQMTGVL